MGIASWLLQKGAEAKEWTRPLIDLSIWENEQQEKDKAITLMLLIILEIDQWGGAEFWIGSITCRASQSLMLNHYNTRLS